MAFTSQQKLPARASLCPTAKMFFFCMFLRETASGDSSMFFCSLCLFLCFAAQRNICVLYKHKLLGAFGLSQHTNVISDSHGFFLWVYESTKIAVLLGFEHRYFPPRICLQLLSNNTLKVYRSNATVSKRTKI